MGMTTEPNLFQRKHRVYYRLLADGTIVGPAHTQPFLHLMVRNYRANREAWLSRTRRDAGLD